jgi:hypothetical protein
VKNFEQVATYGDGNSGAFVINGAVANPGLSASFPWLSGIAKNYQKFRFLYLRYFYSAAVSTANAGTSYIQIQYDVQDSLPTTLAMVLEGDDTSAGPVWFGGAVNADKAFDKSMNPDANVYVDCDVAKLPNPWYYVRTSNIGVQPSSGGALGGTIPGGLTFTPGAWVDQTAIPCKVLYGTNGVTGASGYLYASYIIEFIEPVDPTKNT